MILLKMEILTGDLMELKCIKKINFKGLFLCFIILSLLLIQPVSLPNASAVENVTGADGSFNAPGPDGGTVVFKFEETVDTNKGTVHTFVHLTNNGDKPIKFILCSMMRLGLRDISIPQYEVRQGKNATTEKPYWYCYENGKIDRPPSVHNGCELVVIPPHGSIDKKYDIPYNAPSSDTLSVHSSYFDVLANYPMDASCNKVHGANVNLSPSWTKEFGHDSLNEWAGHTFVFQGTLCFHTIETRTETRSGGGTMSGGENPHSITPGVMVTSYPLNIVPDAAAASPQLCPATAHWDRGNWVTMADDQHQYNVRLVGEITGAPPLTLFTFNLAGTNPVTFAAPQNGTINVNLPFTLFPMDMGEDSLMMNPNNVTIPEGSVITFRGNVTSSPGNPNYHDGQFMYGVFQSFRVDNTPPIVTVMQPSVISNGTVHFKVVATDESGPPMMGTIHLRSDGGQEQVLPLSFINSQIEDNTTTFEANAGPYVNAKEVSYQVQVSDVANNTQTVSSIVPVPEFPVAIVIMILLMTSVIAITRRKIMA